MIALTGCVRGFAQGGYFFSDVVNEKGKVKHYLLVNNNDEMKQYEGQTVKVMGTPAPFAWSVKFTTNDNRTLKAGDVFGVDTVEPVQPTCEASRAALAVFFGQMELVVIRRVILGVLLLGMTGLLVELALLAHYSDLNQQIPLALLGLGITALVLDIAVPAFWTRLSVQLVMVLFIGAGLLGMYFHYRGSREFQLEMDPAIGGVALVSKILQAKSPPTLSPGTMVQMGILGLGYAYLRRTQRT